jgi:hypothetical protein
VETPQGIFQEILVTTELFAGFPSASIAGANLARAVTTAKLGVKSGNVARRGDGAVGDFAGFVYKHYELNIAEGLFKAMFG